MIAVLLSTMLLAADTPPPSIAVTASPRPVAALQAKKSDNGDPMTCWVEKPAGSHVTRTVCATLEELDKAKRDADDALNTRNFNRGLMAK